MSKRYVDSSGKGIEEIPASRLKRLTPQTHMEFSEEFIPERSEEDTKQK
ncbi:hypothetical protein [Geosporobacter ferrireducens]|nr:hypothetical protein [Geosporobacter ferrireducens]